MNSVARSKRRECAKRVIAVVLIVVEAGLEKSKCPESILSKVK